MEKDRQAGREGGGVHRMQPRRYVSNAAELFQRRGEAKQWACPHCRQIGQLNGHGRLRGCAETGAHKNAVRGQRFFCSNRGRRRGCGRTFSVLLATVLAHASVRTGILGHFLSAYLAGASVSGAWSQRRSGFSVEAAYGWRRRWQRTAPALRTALMRGRDPPPGPLWAALTCAYGASDPIADYQRREQRPWP